MDKEEQSNSQPQQQEANHLPEATIMTEEAMQKWLDEHPEDAKVAPHANSAPSAPLMDDSTTPSEGSSTSRTQPYKGAESAAIAPIKSARKVAKAKDSDRKEFVLWLHLAGAFNACSIIALILALFSADAAAGFTVQECYDSTLLCYKAIYLTLYYMYGYPVFAIVGVVLGVASLIKMLHLMVKHKTESISYPIICLIIFGGLIFSIIIPIIVLTVVFKMDALMPFQLWLGIQ